MKESLLIWSLYQDAPRYAYCPDMRLYPASAAKILIALALHQTPGALGCETQLLPNESLPPYARWFPGRSTEGIVLDVPQLIRLMLVHSDNASSNALVALLGKDRIDYALESCGLSPDRIIHSAAPTFRGKITMSARDLYSIYRKVVEYEDLVAILGDEAIRPPIALQDFYQKSGYLYHWNGDYVAAMKRFLVGKPVVEVYRSCAGVYIHRNDVIFIGGIIQFSAMPWNYGMNRLGRIMEPLVQDHVLWR